MSDIELYDQKSKTATALLAFFLGTFGAHRFYLGQAGRGILYLLFFWTFLPSIISFIDFLVYLSMSNDRFDRKYNPHLYERRFGQLGQRPRPAAQPTLSATNPVPPQRLPSTPQAAPGEHDRLLREVGEIRNDILRQIQANPEFRSGVVSEIRPLVDTYIAQVRELIERDKQMKEVTETHSMKEIDQRIVELQAKMQTVSSVELRSEYQRALERHQQHRNSVREFFEQREMIGLRLDSTLMSLREVKLDLLRLQNLNREEQRQEFARLFDEKTSDLSDYLSSLKQTYNDNRV